MANLKPLTNRQKMGNTQTYCPSHRLELLFAKEGAFELILEKAGKCILCEEALAKVKNG